MSAEIPQRNSGKKVADRNYSLAAFERFCSELRVEDGSPLALEPFQKRILTDHFAGCVEEVVVIPKKNGKSTLFSALALFHLANWIEADPEVPIGASSRDQATILYNQAAAMVERSGVKVDKTVFRIAGVDYDVRRGYRLIRLAENDNARIRVLAADANTADGVIPTLALVDELHRHPSGDLYGVFRDGLDGRDGQMVTMSTAGLSEESPLGELRTKAVALESFERKGTYAHAATEDRSFVLHEWSLTSEDDRNDLKLVKKANPASWQTLEKLSRRKNSPSMSPGRWARFACGVWNVSDEPWIEAAEWDGLAVDIGGVVEGEKVWAAVLPGEGAAIALAAPRPDDVAVVAEGDFEIEVSGAAVKVWIFDPAPGLAQLEAQLLNLAKVYDIQSVLYDPREFQRSAELLGGQGLEMLDEPGTALRWSMASVSLKRLIDAQVLRHDGDRKLRDQVLTAPTKDSEQGWRLEKSAGSKGVVAMATAVHHATQVAAPPPRPFVVVGKVG